MNRGLDQDVSLTMRDIVDRLTPRQQQLYDLCVRHHSVTEMRLEMADQFARGVGARRRDVAAVKELLREARP